MSDDGIGDDGARRREGSHERVEWWRVAHDGGRRADDRELHTLEAIFRTLASQRRRYILYELRGEEVSDLETLAAAVTAMGAGVSVDEVPPDEVTNTKTQLKHADIPLLEDAGFVEYDARSEAVRYDGPPLLDPILEICAEVDRL